MKPTLKQGKKQNYNLIKKILKWKNYIENLKCSVMK